MPPREVSPSSVFHGQRVVAYYRADTAQPLGYASHVAQTFLNAMRKIKVQSPEDDFEPFQIHSRPLGNVVYIMTSLFTKPQVMRAMEKAVMGQLTSMQKE